MVKLSLKLAMYTVVLSLLSPSVFAQTDNWGGFKDILADKGSSGGSGGSTTVNSNSGSTPTNVVQTGSCSITKDSQNTVPLHNVLEKLGGKLPFFNVKEIQGQNKVEVTSTYMIAECNDMLEMGVNVSDSDPVRYFVKVSVKGSKTVNDFVKCINDKAMVNGKPNPDASIGTLSAEFAFEKSGKVQFVSEGPMAGTSAAEIKGCNYVENISKDDVEVYTVADRTKRERDVNVNEICKSADSYKDISDEFITRYQEYKGILEGIRNQLLLKEVEALGKAIRSQDDISALDYSVITDFKKYIIDPLMNDIKVTYAEYIAASGDNKKALEKKLKDLKAKLASYGKSPYLSESDFNKLKTKGQFDAAEELFALRTSIKQYIKIGTVEDGSRTITPAIADQKIKNDLNDSRMVFKEERLKYAVKTGEITGKSAQYANIANTLNKNIESRSKDFNTKATQIIEKAQRECPRRFTQQAQQRCMQDYANALKRMQDQLKTRNERDRLLQAKFSARATEYAGYEATGKAYTKSQNGELYDDESDDASADDIIIADTEISMPVDLTMPSTQSNGDQYRNPAAYNQFQGGNNNMNFFNPQYGGGGGQGWGGQQQGWGGGNQWGGGGNQWGGGNPFMMGTNYGGFNNYPYNSYNNFYGGGQQQGWGGNQWGGGFNFGAGAGGGFNNGWGGGNQGWGGQQQGWGGGNQGMFR